MENVEFGEVVQGDFPRIHPQEKYSDSNVYDYIYGDVGGFSSRDTHIFSTKTSLNNKQIVTFKKGFKFRSDLVAKKDFSVEFTWKTPELFCERDNAKSVRFVDFPDYPFVIDMSYNREWNENYSHATTTYFGGDKVVDEEVEEVVEEIKSDYRFLKEEFWCLDHKLKDNRHKFYNEVLRKFFKDVFNKNFKEVLSDKDRDAYYDSKKTWTLKWSNYITGIPINGKSVFLGKDYLAFKEYCEGDGKDVPLEIPIGSVLKHNTTFGEYFKECKISSDDTKKGDKTNGENFPWYPLRIFKRIGEKPVIDVTNEETIEKVKLSDISFNVSCWWAEGCGSGNDTIEGVDTFDKFIAKIESFFDEFGWGIDSFTISPDADDLTDVDDWEWNDKDLVRNRGLGNVWRTEYKEIVNWLDSFAKEG